MKAKPEKPNWKRKPGKEGLPYKPAGKITGGEFEEQPKDGLGAGEGVKGKKSMEGPTKQ